LKLLLLTEINFQSSTNNSSCCILLLLHCFLATQAGNKGLLTFRSDIGIPGYTGYAPGWCTVPLPITGSTEHVGRLPHESQLLAATAAKAGQHQATTECVDCLVLISVS